MLGNLSPAAPLADRFHDHGTFVFPGDGKLLVSGCLLFHFSAAILSLLRIGIIDSWCKETETGSVSYGVMEAVLFLSFRSR